MFKTALCCFSIKCTFPVLSWPRMPSIMLPTYCYYQLLSNAFPIRGLSSAKASIESGKLNLSRPSLMKCQPKFVWERFPTAIKIDRIPLFDVSRHRHGYGVIGRFTPRRDSTFISFFHRSNRPSFLPAAELKRRGRIGTYGSHLKY